MQSFRERCGFHGNQQNYQPTSQDSSRLENYRHQSQPGLNCERQRQVTKGYYTQPSYQGYENNTGEKYPRGDKQMNVQQLQGRVSFASFPEGSVYPAQYSGEDGMQNWGQAQTLVGAKYEENLIKKITGEGRGYQDPNRQLPFRSQTLHHQQQSTMSYAKMPRQKVQNDVRASPLSFSQSPHFNQSFPTQSPTYSSVAGGSQVSHSFKSCTAPSNPPHELPIANTGQRVQAMHGYQSTRLTSYEQQQRQHAQETLHYQNMAKYQHYSQQGQTYCQNETPSRTPEQYYQPFSPSANHSPGRSVGRSPSYSSTPSPLMPNLENFQYNQQQQHNTGSFPLGMSDHSHYMPLLNPSPTGTSSPESQSKSLQNDKIPETLLSDLSLQSLTALTSQVENISSTVQQILMSKAGIPQKKGIKTSPRTSEQMKGQHCSPESTTYSTEQLGTPLSETLGTPQSVHTEIQDGDYLSGSEDHIERNYLCCGPSQSPGRANNSKMKTESISTCSVTSPDNMSSKSNDSFQSIHASLPLETFAKLVSSERECPHLLVNALSQEELSTEIIALQDAIENEKAEKAWADSPVLDNDSSKSPFHLENHTDCVDSVVKSTWSNKRNLEDFTEAFKKSNIETTELTNHNNTDFRAKSCDKELISSEPTKSIKAENSLEFSSETIVKAATSSASYTPYSNTTTDTNCSKTTDPFDWTDKNLNESCLRWKELELSLHSSDLHKGLFQSKESKIDCQLDVPDVETPLENDSGEEFNKEGADDLSFEDVSKADNEKWLEDTRDCYTEDEFQDIPDIPSQKESNLEPEDYASLCDFSDRKSFIYDVSTPKPLVVSEELSSINTPGSVEIPSTEEKENSVPSSHLSGHSISLLGPAVGTESKVKSWFESTLPHIKTVEDIKEKSEPDAETTETSMVQHSVPEKIEETCVNTEDNQLLIKAEEELKSKPVRRRRNQSRISKATELDNVFKNTSVDVIGASNEEKSQANEVNLIMPIIVAKVPTEDMPARMCTRSSTAKVEPQVHGPILGLKAPLQEKLTKRGPFGVIQRGPFKAGRRSGKTAVKVMTSSNDQSAFVFQKKSLRHLANTKKDKEISCKLKKDERSMILRSRNKKEELFQTKRKKGRKGIKLGLKKRSALKKIIASNCTVSETLKIMPKVRQKMKLSNSGIGINVKNSERTLHSLKRKPNFISPIPAKKKNVILRHKKEKVEKPETPPKLFKKIKSTKKTKVKLTIAAKKACKVILNSTSVRTTQEVCLKIGSRSYGSAIKTKVLPPRKGRGLKMEAIVQKITSPNQKKQGSTGAGSTCPVTNSSSILVHGSDLAASSSLLEDSEMKTLNQDMTQNSHTKSESDLHSLNCSGSNSRSLKGKPAHKKKGRSVSLHSELGTHILAEPERKSPNAKRLSIDPKQRLKRGRSRGAMSTSKTSAKKCVSSPSVHLTSREKAASKSVLLASKHPPNEYKQTKVKQCSSLPNATKQLSSQTRTRKKAKYPTFNGYTKRQRKSSSLSKSTNRVGGKRRTTRRSAPLISPKEPEIKLKYVSSKPVRTESRSQLFSPYVQVEKRNEFTTTCTVINTVGEETRLLKERNTTRTVTPTQSFASPGSLPISSRMQLGPLVSKAMTTGCLVCCLCQCPANYKDLGDLCGPYYPVDCLPTKKIRPKDKLRAEETLVERSLKAADSVCTTGIGKPFCLDSGAVDPAKHNSLRSSARSLLRKLPSCYCCSKKTEVMGAEKPKRHQCSKNPEPPPLETTTETKEHWVHEACAVWTSGVYLVAGKLYGVHEAIQMAATGLCPKCQRSGATVGCSHKGCLQSYHYTCAVEAGCLLSEENFSLRCPKHKRHLV
ncbi:retinoic acid-induced protein 1 [Bombina bombina]|uniref:retinoic acid-induced protein 1 n=1 Tax=Bombina bombina TaxID=8345 RepID=UPI00235B26F1|nr:retinoic acid-induced protein 1 [Bombina bombina]XP_053550363.1 retinoic acid-induced protein 1 [Bombina bombina]XP_053550364.1 retinoic acid-induced protein 1 [Bombina bombina]XP_053550365.1 retinoic acid-induced protein 1 [Bombina bombina]XP_053550366.1 retinoic acid-induced protein 1 [Bombina bombina]XP_053550367.1 retinoic acid-induced protein 1 [Bombina bombina]